MTEIIFIGSGAVSAEITSYITDINRVAGTTIYQVKRYLDDSEESYTTNAKKYQFNAPYLGTIKDHTFSTEEHYAFGLASIAVRRMFIDRLAGSELEFPNIIHPSAIIADSAVLGKGNVIYPNSVVGPGVVIGDHNLITSYSFVSHDCRIGENNFLSTAGLAGNVIMGNDNFMGIRATIIPSISIGSGNTIQAGMVVSNNVSDQETVFFKYKEKISIIRN